MSESKRYQTAPEDRIPVLQKFVYGLGALCNQLLPAAIGCMAIVLNLGLGMNPALIGTILAIPRLFDAIIDPVMGYLTDHTKSKWGRRKPYIFVGALLSGLTFALLWQLPAGHSQKFYFWYFTLGSILFYGAYTVFAAPFVALGYEMTPDYHERTSLMGYSNFMGTMTWIIAPWFWFIMDNKTWFADSVQGARILAIIVGIFFAVVGILPAIFIKERFYEIAKAEGKEDASNPVVLEAETGKSSKIKSFLPWVVSTACLLFVLGGKTLFPNAFAGLRDLVIAVGVFFVLIGALNLLRGWKVKSVALQELLSKFTSFFNGFFVTFKNVEFLKLCATTFSVFNGFMMISGLGSYIIIYYVFGGPAKEIAGKAAGWYIGWFGSISALSTCLATPVITKISNKVGKRNAFFISMSIAIFGYVVKWFCYMPEKPWMIFLAAPFVSFALGGLFTLVGSMMADVCDLDELNNGQRREGMFGAVYWWMVKLGMAVALFMSGYLMNWTGFDVKFGDAQPAQSMFLMRLFEIGISIATLIVAMAVIGSYKITEARANEIRQTLEKRRGKATAPATDDLIAQPEGATS